MDDKAIVSVGEPGNPIRDSQLTIYNGNPPFPIRIFIDG